jgi:hypothetical protein
MEAFADEQPSLVLLVRSGCQAAARVDARMPAEAGGLVSRHPSNQVE